MSPFGAESSRAVPDCVGVTVLSRATELKSDRHTHARPPREDHAAPIARARASRLSLAHEKTNPRSGARKRGIGVVVGQNSGAAHDAPSRGVRARFHFQRHRGQPVPCLSWRGGDRSAFRRARPSAGSSSRSPRRRFSSGSAAVPSCPCSLRICASTDRPRGSSASSWRRISRRACSPSSRRASSPTGSAGGRCSSSAWRCSQSAALDSRSRPAPGSRSCRAASRESAPVR